MRPQKYGEEEELKIKALRTYGMTLEKIALSLNLPKSHVFRVVKKLFPPKYTREKEPRPHYEKKAIGDFYKKLLKKQVEKDRDLAHFLNNYTPDTASKFGIKKEKSVN